MNQPGNAPASGPRSVVIRFLDAVERVGNRLPDPAVLFLLLMLAVWGVSALLASVSFTELDPRSGDPIRIRNLLEGASFTAFMADMVRTFVNFAPLGVVLVAMLGLGVAGVDLVASARGPLVLEVNSTPGLEGVEGACGVDVAGAIIDYVAEKSKKNQ